MEAANQELTSDRENLPQPENPNEPLRLNSLNEAEAFAAIAIAAVAADGHLVDTEKRAIFLCLARMKLFEEYSDAQLKTMLEKLLELFKQHGYEALIEAAKNFLQPELRTTAFAVSIDLVLSDRILHKIEKRFLDRLQEVLEVSDETAAKLIEAMMIKNRG